MATTKKPRLTRITSPIGTVKFAFLDKPSTKFKEKGEYSVQLLFSKEEIAPIAKQLKELAEGFRKAAVEDAKNPKEAKKRAEYKLTYGITAEEDDEGTATGNYILKAKTGAQRVNKKTEEVTNVTVPVWDAKKNKIPCPKVGKGTRLKVAFDVAPFCMDATNTVGATLYLAGVQIIDLVEWGGGGDADSMGFGEEDGYEGSGGGEEDAPFGEEKPAAAEGSGDF